MNDIEVIGAAAELFAARLWDAVTELMETETGTELRTPTPRWDAVSPQTRERFVTLMMDKQLAAPLVGAVGFLARLERGERN